MERVSLETVVRPLKSTILSDLAPQFTAKHFQLILSIVHFLVGSESGARMSGFIKALMTLCNTFTKGSI